MEQSLLYLCRPFPSGGPVRFAPLAVLAILTASSLFQFAAAGPQGEQARAPWPVTSISKTVEIPAGGRLVLAFNATNGTVYGVEVPDYAAGLSEKSLQAVARAPAWLRHNLSRSLAALGSGADRYSDLILAADAKYVDEAAFSIAHTSTDILRPHNYPGLFVENARWLYENAGSIGYAELVEKGDWTTVKYWVRVNGSRTSFELPRGIYYWYIVHPKVTDDFPTYIDPATGNEAAPPAGRFWRDFLYNEADAAWPADPSGGPAYPREFPPPKLKDMLAGVDVLWDASPKIVSGGTDDYGYNSTRPLTSGTTAMERVSNWVEASLTINVAESQKSERSVQPVRIYRNHYGNCGELSDLSVASDRAALIPSIETGTIAQDHIWQQFWDGKWWHYDNWWSYSASFLGEPHGDGASEDKETGGPKDISTVFAWDGNDATWSATRDYTPTGTLTIQVLDRNGAPADGANVMTATQSIYNPNLLSIDWWNTTNADGIATFPIGNNHTYYARVDHDTLGSPLPTGQVAPVVMTTSQVNGSYSYTFHLPGAKPNGGPKPTVTPPQGTGPYRLSLNYSVTGNVVPQKNLLTNTRGLYPVPPTTLDVFIANSTHYARYRSGSAFTAAALQEAALGVLNFTVPDSDIWYFVLSNEDSMVTTKVVNLTLSLSVEPYLTLDHPAGPVLVSGGTALLLEGRTDGNISRLELSADNGTTWTDITSSHNGSAKRWSYQWQTAGLGSGVRSVTVRMLHARGDGTMDTLTTPPLTVTVDSDDPVIRFHLPPTRTFPADPGVVISGTVSDNIGVAGLDINPAGEGWRAVSIPADGRWSLHWDAGAGEPGAHTLQARAVDLAGRTSLLGENFSVDAVGPRVDAAAGAARVRAGDTVEVGGNATDELAIERVEVGAGGSAWTRAALTGTRWNWTWDTDGLPSGPRTLDVRAFDGANHTAAAKVTVVVDGDAPKIAFTAPRGTTVEAGSAAELAGTAVDPGYDGAWDGTVARLDLEYNGTWYDMLPSFSDGAWQWTWDTTGLLPGNSTFTLRAVDSVGNAAERNLTLRLVDTTPPRLQTTTLPSPAVTGTTVEVAGTASDPSGIAAVEASFDGGGWMPADYITAKGRWYLSWRVPAAWPGEHTLTFRALDGAGNEATLTRTVTLADREPAVLAVTAPPAGARLKAGTVPVAGTLKDNVGIRTVEMQVDGGPWQNISSSYSYAAGTWGANITLKPGSHSVTVRAQDAGGAWTTQSVTFRVVSPPQNRSPGFDGLIAAAAAAGAALVTVARARRR